MVAEGVRTTASAIRAGARARRSRCRSVEEVGAVLFDAQAGARGARGPACARSAARRGAVRWRGLRCLSCARTPSSGAGSSSPPSGRAGPSDFPPTRWQPKGGPCVFCAGQEARTPDEVWALRPDGRPSEPAGLARPRRAEQVPGAPDRGRARAVGRGALRPDERGGSARGRHRGARARCRDRAACPRRISREVLLAYRERILDLAKDPRTRVRPGLQEPRRAGRRLARAPPLPAHRDARSCRSMVEEELAGGLQHFRIKQRCIWCDIVRQERRDGPRLVLEEGGFVALAPFAPRFPFETWILPDGPPVELRGHAGRGPRRRWRASCRRSWAGHGAPPRAIPRTTSCSTARPLRTPDARPLPLAPRDHSEADAGGRVRVGNGLLHQSDAARGGGGVPPRARRRAGWPVS